MENHIPGIKFRKLRKNKSDEDPKALRKALLQSKQSNYEVKYKTELHLICLEFTNIFSLEILDQNFPFFMTNWKIVFKVINNDPSISNNFWIIGPKAKDR